MNCGLNESVLDIFQRGITKQVCQHVLARQVAFEGILCVDLDCQSNTETKSFSSFRELHKDPSVTKGGEAQIDDLCDVTEEVNALLEIKDIENELKMIDKVFLQQERLIKKYQRRRGLSSIEVDGLHSLLTGLVGRRARVQELAQDAQSVELSVS